MKKITNNQKKIIWTMIRKNHIDEDGFRDWLQRDFETRSTRELTYGQAEGVIRSLKVFTGNEHKQHPFTWGITERQIWKAKKFAEELEWHEPQRLTGLVKKMFGKPDIIYLNKTEGSKLIVALEKMAAEVERGERCYA